MFDILRTCWIPVDPKIFSLSFFFFSYCPFPSPPARLLKHAVQHIWQQPVPVRSIVETRANRLRSSSLLTPLIRGRSAAVSLQRL